MGNTRCKGNCPTTASDNSGGTRHPHLQQQLNKQPVLMVQLQMLLVIVPHPLRQHKKQHSLQAATQQTTCPDGSTPDVTGNCPTIQLTREQSAPPKTLTQQHVHHYQ